MKQNRRTEGGEEGEGGEGEGGEEGKSDDEQTNRQTEFPLVDLPPSVAGVE